MQSRVWIANAVPRKRGVYPCYKLYGKILFLIFTPVPASKRTILPQADVPNPLHSSDGYFAQSILQVDCADLSQLSISSWEFDPEVSSWWQRPLAKGRMDASKSVLAEDPLKVFTVKNF